MPEPVFGPNGVVENAEDFEAWSDKAAKAGPKDRALEWREPKWLFLLVAWVFAGPLNPAAFIAAALNDVYFAAYLVSIPSAVGAGIVLRRLRNKDMNTSNVFGSMLVWALVMIPLYMGGMLAITFFSQGLADGIAMAVVKGVNGLLYGIFGSVIYGWIGLIFAIPSALLGAVMIRLVGLRSKQKSEEAN